LRPFTSIGRPEDAGALRLRFRIVVTARSSRPDLLAEGGVYRQFFW
jgi:hypothetical protein